MTVHNIETVDGFKEAIRSHDVVMVDWFATWCGPCKAIAPMVAKWSNENTDIYFIKVDVDNLPELSQEYSIRAMPTFTFFKDGEKVDEFVGANPAALQKLVVKHKPAADEAAAEKTETA
ncbi:hypothetical protein NKR23_g8762 [Pleurostoma richardsiae]|uniref:Thioredoxin domain-containing protein n=1 Tax=Pleurostoma richardsiae TaxID=41990 RepID=A0AA38REN0_9PEZI|nr:hypothetical protein NKR23_g8762 [Pleurostoma richardsiae]